MKKNRKKTNDAKPQGDNHSPEPPAAASKERKSGSSAVALSLVLLAGSFLLPVFPHSFAHAAANLIGNSNLETEITIPDLWRRGGYGENTAKWSYPLTGINGTRAVRVAMTAYASGDAKWYFDDVPVKPGTTYMFSDSSVSNVPTSVDIRYKVINRALERMGVPDKFRYRYVKLGDVPAYSTSTAKQFTFTTPPNAVSLTIFHYINRIGYLVTDNYSLTEVGIGETPTPADAAAPSVSIAAPANTATVSGTVSVSVNASDNVGVVGVSLVHSGTNHANVPIGVEDTAAPYTFEWNTVGVPNGVHTLEARARDAAGNVATSSAVRVTVLNATTDADAAAPAVAITAPIGGSTVSGTTTISVTANDNVAVTSNTLFVDGVSTASLGTSSPATFEWGTLSVADGVHTLYAVAADSAGNMATSSPVSVTVQNTNTTDTTAPTVSIAVPANGAAVYGTTTVSVNASDNVGVAGVTILLDDVAVSAEDTATPYSFDWNTTSASNGSHTLTARARDAAGNIATSTAVTVTVSN